MAGTPQNLCEGEVMTERTSYEYEQAIKELVEGLELTLQHVEDETAERTNGQCTLCYSYRSMIRALIAKHEVK